jgi:hypothetical protein
MTRDDERKQIAGVARSPSAARRAEDPIAREHVSHESDDRENQPEEHGTDASMSRTPAGAKRAIAREMAEEHDEEHDRPKNDTISGGRGIMHESVEADHVIGTGGKVGVKSAEGESDMASAGANRKEAGEPERERNEKAAMGKERGVPTKNTMGWGERETKAEHTT